MKSFLRNQVRRFFITVLLLGVLLFPAVNAQAFFLFDGIGKIMGGATQIVGGILSIPWTIGSTVVSGTVKIAGTAVKVPAFILSIPYNALDAIFGGSSSSSSGRASTCITSFSADAYSYLGPVSSTGQDPRTKEDVLKIQMFLAERGYLGGTSFLTGPGIFGPATRSALTSFFSHAGVSGLTVGGTLTGTHLDFIKDVSCSSAGHLFATKSSIQSGELTQLRLTKSGQNMCIHRSNPSDSNWDGSQQSGARSPSALTTVSPRVTTTYEIYCPPINFPFGTINPGNQSGAYGQVTVTVGGSTSQTPTVDLRAASVDVNFVAGSPWPAPSTVNLTDGPLTLNQNENLYLQWSSTNTVAGVCRLAVSGTANGPFGIDNPSNDPSNGFVSALPSTHPWYPTSSGTTYTLTCYATNAQGSVDFGNSASDSVTVSSFGAISPPPVNPPPPVSSQFFIGEVIRTTSNVNVRTGPSLASRSFAISSVGLQGTVIGGPTSADGFIWWEVRFIGGITGWTAGNYLQGVAPVLPPVTPPPTLSLSASPTSITQGNSSTISWTSINATSCTASNGWSGSKATSGYQSVSPLKETTYTLTCTGNGGNTSQSVTVNLLVIDPQFPPVPLAPTINNFSAIPSIITSGQSVSLSWSTSNATSCSASNGWSGKRSTSGSQTFFPVNSPTTYTLTCSSSAGSTSQSVTVAVAPVLPPVTPPPTLSLSASPTSITQGNSSTISWTSINATSCTASNGWSGSKATSGSQSVSPLTATTYTLTCTGNGGNTSQSVTVNLLVIDPQFPPVPPSAPTVTLSANGQRGTASVEYGKDVSLSWTAQPLTSPTLNCTGSGGSGIWPGGKPLTGLAVFKATVNTTYAIYCTDSATGLSAKDSVSVYLFITDPYFPPAPVTPTVDLMVKSYGGSFSQGPITVSSGQTVDLSWTSTNANSCTASGGWTGNFRTSGSLAGLGPLSFFQVFSIICYDSVTGLNANDSVIVYVLNPNTPVSSSQQVKLNQMASILTAIQGLINQLKGN